MMVQCSAPERRVWSEFRKRLSSRIEPKKLCRKAGARVGPAVVHKSYWRQRTAAGGKGARGEVQARSRCGRQQRGRHACEGRRGVGPCAAAGQNVCRQSAQRAHRDLFEFGVTELMHGIFSGQNEACGLLKNKKRKAPKAPMQSHQRARVGRSGRGERRLLKEKQRARSN